MAIRLTFQKIGSYRSGCTQASNFFQKPALLQFSSRFGIELTFENVRQQHHHNELLPIQHDEKILKSQLTPRLAI